MEEKGEAKGLVAGRNVTTQELWQPVDLDLSLCAFERQAGNEGNLITSYLAYKLAMQVKNRVPSPRPCPG